MYSITSRSSFDRAREILDWIEKLKENMEDFSIIIVGNKKDLESERQVGTDELKKLSEENGAIRWTELTCRSNVEVWAVIEESFRKYNSGEGSRFMRWRQDWNPTNHHKMEEQFKEKE